jgi:hypothetical protein
MRKLFPDAFLAPVRKLGRDAGPDENAKTDAVWEAAEHEN